MKSLPHLTFLRSFEAAARHLSFTSAAEELNSTQASVSNHVRSLEDYIGRPLFVRHARSLTLTDVGLGYLPSVQRALQDLDAATRSLVTDHASHAVTVSCPVSLTENWMPRVMAGFHKTHPKIELALNSTVWADLQENASDITITIAHEDDVDPSAQRLWADKLVLLCAPSYPKVSAETLSDERAIHILGRPEYWNAVTEKTWPHRRARSGRVSMQFHNRRAGTCSRRCGRRRCAKIARSEIAGPTGTGRTY